MTIQEAINYQGNMYPCDKENCKSCESLEILVDTAEKYLSLQNQLSYPISNAEYKYTHKHIIIDAFQYNGDFMYQDGAYYVPDWAVDALKRGVFKFVDDGELIIYSRKGTTRVWIGDYIIKGIDGEIYPCEKHIFKLLYTKLL